MPEIAINRAQQLLPVMDKTDQLLPVLAQVARFLLPILALVVLVRWEVAAFRHPERFDESTNARLSCAQCTEQLCRIRGKIEKKR